MSKSVTLKVVAKHAGVSYQTVSKALRNEGQLSPELRLRVQQAVDELGYRPNAAAQTLRTQSSRLIGYSWCLVRKDHSSFILDEFQHGIVECAEDVGYHILLVPQRDEHDLNAQFKVLADARRVDGFILSSIEFDDPRIESVQGLGVPFVSFGRPQQAGSTPFVDVDGRAGLALVVRHLAEQGHRRIAAIAWPESSRVGSERLAGYLDTMAALGLPIDPAWVIHGMGEIEYGYTAAQQLLAAPSDSRPTAIVTLLDTIALGVMQAVDSCGLLIGRDIAVTGFDDMPAARHLKPGLTTVRQPIWAVSKAVLSLLLAQFTRVSPSLGSPERAQPDAQPQPQQLMLAPELVIRESSLGYAQAHLVEGAVSTHSN